MPSTSSGQAGSSLGSNVGVRGRKGVRQEDVSGAADAILAAGVRPTVERIRAHLGTGSPNTVAPMLEWWFKSLSARVAGMAPSPASDGLPAAAQNAFRLLWDTALSEARGACERALATEREELAKSAAAVEEQTRVLEGSRAALEESARATRGQVEALAGQLEQLQKALAARETELQAAHDHAQQLAERAGAERENVREELLAMRQERERDRERSLGTERRLLAEVDLARADAKRQERTSAALAADLSSARASTEKLHSDNLALSRELAALQERLAQSQAQVGREQVAAAAARELLAAVQARATDLAASLDEERRASGELRLRVAAAEKKPGGRSSRFQAHEGRVDADRSHYRGPEGSPRQHRAPLHGLGSS